MTTEEEEAPAKIWQVNAVSDGIVRIETKLNKLIDNQVSVADLENLRRSLDEKFQTQAKIFDDKLESQRKEVDLTYGPLASNVRWLLRAFILGVIGAFGELAASFAIIFGHKP